MNQLPILIRREFWENRNVFLVLPAAIVVFQLVMFFFVGVVSTPENVEIHIESDGDAEFIQDILQVDNAYEYAIAKLSELRPEDRQRAVRTGLMLIAATMLVVAWLVTLFYLLNSLYSDRRDRSILFWKSLPVSDGLTVLVKLLTGVVIVPVIYLCGAVLVQIIGLLILTVVAIGVGTSAWEVVWQPAFYPGLLAELGLAVIFLALWHLPLFGWLLTVSAFARSVPFVWALGVPSAIVIAEGVVTNQTRLGTWIGNHAVPSRLVEDGRSLIDNMMSHAVSLEMVSAIVVGAALVFAAIWLRGKADEI